jgi:hypothetical protein
VHYYIEINTANELIMYTTPTEDNNTRFSITDPITKSQHVTNVQTARAQCLGPQTTTTSPALLSTALGTLSSAPPIITTLPTPPSVDTSMADIAALTKLIVDLAANVALMQATQATALTVPTASAAAPKTPTLKMP